MFDPNEDYAKHYQMVYDPRKMTYSEVFDLMMARAWADGIHIGPREEQIIEMPELTKYTKVRSIWPKFLRNIFK